MFSGSYESADVTFLLRPVQLAYTPVAEKERLIQSGVRHYSEMISPERPPSPSYLAVYESALAANLHRFAQDLRHLAALIAASRTGPLAIVSLARAGTPIGVLMKRAIERFHGRRVDHYSLSVIRDRGVDTVALRQVLEQHDASSVVFLDGWTGKGVIARELAQAIRSFNATTGSSLDPGLYAVADLCGHAVAAATGEDYLIPSCILGATISGLVSRSILNAEVVGPGETHACLYLDELAPFDQSRAFVDRVSAAMAEVDTKASSTRVNAQELRSLSEQFLSDLRQRFGVMDVNRLKPGIGEATRVLLRRVPDVLLVRDVADEAVAHLMVLAEEKQVAVQVDPNMPYRAAAVIRDVRGEG